MARDPIGFAGGDTNLYGYVGGNPIMFIDPRGLESYLVSRPLSHPAIGWAAGHDFIVTNANSVGDTSAEVYSYGNNGNGIMGRVTNETTGPSATTNQTDIDAWLSLSSNSRGAVTFRRIDGLDSTVKSYALSLNQNQRYSFVPELLGGVNSNTAAGAIANMSDGSYALVTGGIIEPGASVAYRVSFNDRVNYMCIEK
jgi:hypothetical protein